MDSALLSGLLAEGDVLIYGGANDSGLSNGSHIQKFAKFHDGRDSMGHVVMILQLAKVKYFNEKPSVSNDMYSTKLYINDDIPEISFHCILYAKKYKIHHEHGWTYLACKRCRRSAKEVDDDQSSSSASLLLFDNMVFKLSGEQFYNLIKQHGPNYDDYFPDELNILVGKRLLFRFHYTDEHITNNNHVYQVKMMLEDEAMITLFKKDFIIVQCQIFKFNTVDSFPFNTDETPKSVDGSSKRNGINEDGQGSSKAIESDEGYSGSGKRTIIDLDDYDEDGEKAKRVKKVVQVKVEPKD
ncbi:replication protein A 70 kDa DNA-binding subunit B [Tanacetum coccineum]